MATARRQPFRPVTNVVPPPTRQGGISLTMNINEAASALSQLAGDVQNRSIPNRQIGIQLYGWVIRNFQQSGAMQQPPWVALAPSTLERKQKEGYSSQPLIRRGNLRQSFAPFADDTQAGVGARAAFGIDYARIHETGSTQTPGRPPQRAMLPPRDYALNASVQIYNLHIQTSIRRAGL